MFQNLFRTLLLVSILSISIISTFGSTISTLAQEQSSIPTATCPEGFTCTPKAICPEGLVCTEKEKNSEKEKTPTEVKKDDDIIDGVPNCLNYKGEKNEDYKCFVNSPLDSKITRNYDFVCEYQSKVNKDNILYVCSIKKNWDIPNLILSTLNFIILAFILALAIYGFFIYYFR